MNCCWRRYPCCLVHYIQMQLPVLLVLCCWKGRTRVVLSPSVISVLHEIFVAALQAMSVALAIPLRKYSNIHRRLVLEMMKCLSFVRSSLLLRYLEFSSVPKDHCLAWPRTELMRPVPLGVDSHGLCHCFCAEFAVQEWHVLTTENAIKNEIPFISFTFCLLVLILIIHKGFVQVRNYRGNLDNWGNW